MLAVVYVLFTLALYYLHLMPLLFTGLLDGLFFIASIIVPALLGRRRTTLVCDTLENSTSTKLFEGFVALEKQSCTEINAVYGIYIAICLLFVFSSLVCVGLWRQARRDSKRSPLDLEA